MFEWAKVRYVCKSTIALAIKKYWRTWVGKTRREQSLVLSEREKEILTCPGKFPTNNLLFNLLAGVSLSCSSLSNRLSRLGRAGEKASGASSSISSSGEDSWSPEFNALKPISGSEPLDSNSLHFLGDGVRHNLKQKKKKKLAVSKVTRLVTKTKKNVLKKLCQLF